MTMPASYLDYYMSVADRMLPFLQGRQIAIEQRFPRSKGIVYRRHTGGSGDDTWIRIATRDALLDWARQHAVGLHAHLRSEDQGAWFVIDIDSRVLPDRKSTRLNSSHANNSYAVFCLKKKKKNNKLFIIKKKKNKNN